VATDCASATFRHAKIQLHAQVNIPRSDLAPGLKRRNVVPRSLIAPARSRLTTVAVQQGECAGGGLYRFALNIGTDRREDQVFDVSKRTPTNESDDRETDQPVGGTLLEQLAGAEGQRIYLPRRSDSSAVSKWLADEAWRKRGRRRIN
jgi:hypothetical protein